MTDNGTDPTPRVPPGDLFVAETPGEEPPLTERFGDHTFDNLDTGPSIGYQLAREMALDRVPDTEPNSDDPGDAETAADDVCPYPAGWPRPEAQ